MSGLKNVASTLPVNPVENVAPRSRVERDVAPVDAIDAPKVGRAGEAPTGPVVPSLATPAAPIQKKDPQWPVDAAAFSGVSGVPLSEALVAGTKFTPRAGRIDDHRLNELTRIVAKKTEVVLTVFDAEFDDFLALGPPNGARHLLVTGARPEYIARELDEAGHRTLACAPIVMGSQAKALGGVDTMLLSDATMDEVDARVEGLLQHLASLASTTAGKATRIDSGSNSTLATSLVLLMQHGERAHPAVKALLAHDALLQCNKANPKKWQSNVKEAELQFIGALADLARSLTPQVPVVVVASSLVKKTGEVYELGGANFESNPVASAALLTANVDVILSHRSCSGPVSELTSASIATELAQAQVGTESHALWTDVQRLFHAFLVSNGPVATRSKAFNVPQVLRWCRNAVSAPQTFKRWGALAILLRALRDDAGQLSVDQVLVGDASMTALARAKGALPLQALGEHVFVQCPETHEGDADSPGLISMLSCIVQGFTAVASHDAALASHAQPANLAAPSRQEVVTALEAFVDTFGKDSEPAAGVSDTLGAARAALQLLMR